MPIQAKPGASIDVTPTSGSANQIYGEIDFETVRKPRETRCSATCYLYRTVAVAPTAWRHCSWRSLLSPACPTTERPTSCATGPVKRIARATLSAHHRLRDGKAVATRAIRAVRLPVGMNSPDRLQEPLSSENLKPNSGPSSCGQTRPPRSEEN